MPVPPPTSPYLQALERASKGSAAGYGNNRSSRQAIALAGEDGDNDGEGDVCWVCGNATRASQAYCSNTCRDEDNRLQQETAQDQSAEELLLIDHIDALQLSPAVHAVPALIPSGSSSSTKPRSGHSSASGNTTPHAATSRRSSGTNTNTNLHLASSNNALTALETLNDGHRGNHHHHHHTSTASNRRSSRKSGTNSSSINGITTEASSGTTTTTGSSSSPPSSSATSSPAMRTSADEEIQQGGRRQQPRVEEDIEGLLLPPPAAGVVAEVVNANGGKTSPNKKQHQQQHQHQHFDYAYPYAVRPKSSSGLIIPKSPPPLHVAKTTLPAPGGGAISSTGMRKSSSQQHNRHTSNGQNKMLSPIFGPKSVGSSLHPEATRSSIAGTNTSNAKNTQHDHTNTPPLKASEVITFRRRHYATDSLNGQHKASNHGGREGGSSTAGSSSTNSPAVKAATSTSTAHASSSSTNTTNTTATPTTNSSSSNSSSRRHSSHGSSVLTSPNMLPAFSPLIKARSITSKSIPTLNSVNGQGNNTHSPKLKAVDSVSSTSASAIQPPHQQQQQQHGHHHGLSSPSLAASTLSDLLHRTTSKGDSSSTLPAIAGNKRASKSDSLLTGPALASSSSSKNPLRSPGVPATSQGLPSTSSSSALSGTTAAKGENTGHNKASWLQRNKLTKNFFSFNGPLSSSSLTGRISDHAQSQPHSQATCARKNCPVNHATHPLASFFTPLTRRSSEPGSPFASPAIYYSDNLDPFEESFSKSASGSITTTLRNSASTTNGVDGVRRRPSLSTSITAPPGVTTPSPGVNGVKPQDYSGFAGFLFALHNQRKGGAAAGTSSPLSPYNGDGTSTKEDSRKASFDMYSTPESSESGYDAQDEDHARLEISSSIRGRGRSSRRANATTSASVSGAQAKDQTETAHIAKPALLKEKLNNVVRASNDRSNSTTSSTTDPTPVATDVSPARSNGGKPRGFLFSRGNAFKNSSLAPPETKGDAKSTNTEDEVDEVRIVPSIDKKKQEKDIQIEAVNSQDDLSAKKQEGISSRGRKGASTAPRARHNHSTSVGEGSQYIVNLRGSAGQKAKVSIRAEKGDESSEELTLSDERDSPSRSPERTGVAPNPQQRGRPTARRRSSANGRIAVVSPFTTLERANTFANGEEKQQQLQTEDGGRGRSRARGSAALHRSVSPARSSSRARGRDSPRLRTR